MTVGDRPAAATKHAAEPKDHGHGHGTVTPTRQRVLHAVLADGDPLARRVVREALEGEQDVVVDGDAMDGLEALELVRLHRPHVLVIEAELPGVPGVEVVRRLSRDMPATHAVMLCVRRDDDVALEALRAGADGYLTKEVNPRKLPEVVRRVARGEPVVPSALMPRLLERLRAIPDAGWRPVRSRLTTREWEIVELLEEGASTEGIATALVVSPSTVYSHVKSLMRKLRVHSRREAVVVASELRRAETAAAVPHPAGLPGLPAAPRLPGGHRGVIPTVR